MEAMDDTVHDMITESDQREWTYNSESMSCSSLDISGKTTFFPRE